MISLRLIKIALCPLNKKNKLKKSIVAFPFWVYFIPYKNCVK